MPENTGGKKTEATGAKNWASMPQHQ